MQLVILAGGYGTRLKPISGDLPKPLVPVLGVPLLGRQLRQAAEQRMVDNALILTGYGAEAVAAYVANEDFGFPVHCKAEPTARGTAGAVLDVMSLLDTEFFLMYADTISDIDMARFLAFHRMRNADATLFLHPNDHPFDSDLIEKDDEGNIVGFHSCPHSSGEPLANLVNAGFYILRRDALLGLTELPKMPDFGKHVFPAMLRAGRRLVGYRSHEYIKDAGTPTRLVQVAADIKSGLVASRSFRRQAAAVFLDRDGVLNIADGHISAAAQLKLIPGAAKAVARLNRSMFLSVVITNQPVLARGEASIEDLQRIHAKLETELGFDAAYVDAIYYCPHHPDSGYGGEITRLKTKCNCRKPATGMVEQACRDLNIAPEQSWMIGDTTSDIEMARRANLRSILVRTGEGGRDGKYRVEPDFIADDLADAVDIIFQNSPVASNVCTVGD